MMKVEVVKDDNFEHHHGVVKRGLKTFVEVGNSLRVIKDKELFLEAGYDTFVKYCQIEHSIGKSQAYRLVKAAEIAVDHDVNNENVARALADVPKESRAEVLEIAMDRMGGKPTATMIDDVAIEVVEQEPSTVEQIIEDCAVEFRLVLDECICIGRMIKSLAEDNAGKHIPLQRVQSQLKQVYHDLQWSAPTHVCYACNGRGCDLCKGTGFITQAVHNNRPEEIE